MADKSLLDYLVYGDIVIKEEAFRKIIREVATRNAKYDRVFYLPIEFPMELDGVRSEDVEFQKDVDQRYKEYLSQLGIKYIILSGSVEERVSQALEHLK